MTRGAYYREWLHRAFSGKYGWAEGLSGFAALVMTGAVLLGKRYPAVAEWIPFTIDESVVGVFVAALVGFVILGLVVAPYQMHLEEFANQASLTARIERLEARDGTLSFSDAFAIASFPGHPDSRLCRLNIINGPLRAVQNAEVSLVAYQGEGSPESPLRPLHDANGASHWDLHPGASKAIDVAAVRLDRTPRILYLAPYAPGYTPIKLTSGEYMITLGLSSFQTPVAEHHFRISFAPDGTVNWQRIT